MSWVNPASGMYLPAGTANQFWFSWGGVYQGPQFAVAKLDASSGGTSGADRDLVIQWHGLWNHIVPGGATHTDYIVGVSNPSSANIWFHLEGGGVT